MSDLKVICCLCIFFFLIFLNVFEFESGNFILLKEVFLLLVKFGFCDVFFGKEVELVIYLFNSLLNSFVYLNLIFFVLSKLLRLSFY